MSSFLDTIGQAGHSALLSLLQRQLRVTPRHEKFLTRRFEHASADVLRLCDYLSTRIAMIAGDDIDTFCGDYDFICRIQEEEEYHFRRFDEYRLKSFQDAVREVYANKPYMDSYMNGLLMTQIYWSNHTSCFSFYRDRYLASLPAAYRYVEVGPGHGLLLYEAAQQPHAGSVSAWDLSEASIDQTRSALSRMSARLPVSLTIQNLFEATDFADCFDGVGFSEVLEHLDEPARALAHLRGILKPGGLLFVNVPINSPAPDHLYLLRSPEEAVEALERAGFRIEDRGYYPATNYSLEQARKRALTISVCLMARRV